MSSNVNPDESGWQRLHALTPVLRSLQAALPFGIAAMISLAQAGDGRWIFAVVLMIGFAISLVAIVLTYIRFRYRITDDGLVITHGVLFRQRRVVPRSRIQNIDLEAGPLQQLFGVVTARIETAGGGASEAELNFVAREEGDRLRARLVLSRGGSGRDAAAIPEGDLAEVDVASDRDQEAGAYLPPVRSPDPTAGPVARTTIRTTPFRDLVIAGATSNRAGVIFGALFGGDIFFGFVPTDWLLRPWLPPELLQEGTGLELLIRAAEHGVDTFLTALWVTGVMFALTGWALSVLASALRYFNFTLTATPRELQVSYGLLTRREKGFRRVRVQNVQVEESLLRRWLGLATLRVQTAGYGPQTKSEQKVETLSPLARGAEVAGYLRLVFEDLDWDRIEWRPAHPLARRRLFVRRAVPVLLLTVGLAFVIGPWATLGLLGLAPAWFFAGLHYRHLGHSRLDHFVLTREGFWNRRTHVVPVRKIQVTHLKETPFQRRLGLGTLLVDTAGSPEPVPDILAGGEARAIDLDRAYALEVMDDLGSRVAATGLTF